jgi:hypothetical protein
MLGAATIHRPSVKAKLEKAIESSDGVRSYIRAALSEDGKSVTPLAHQEEIKQMKFRIQTEVIWCWLPERRSVAIIWPQMPILRSLVNARCWTHCWARHRIANTAMQLK